MAPAADFSLTRYTAALEQELLAFGFNVRVDRQERLQDRGRVHLHAGETGGGLFDIRYQGGYYMIKVMLAVFMTALRKPFI